MHPLEVSVIIGSDAEWGAATAPSVVAEKVPHSSPLVTRHLIIIRRLVTLITHGGVSLGAGVKVEGDGQTTLA